jgi:hypothetical protein
MREQITPLSELRKNAIAAFAVLFAVSVGAALVVQIMRWGATQ